MYSINLLITDFIERLRHFSEKLAFDMNEPRHADGIGLEAWEPKNQKLAASIFLLISLLK